MIRSLSYISVDLLGSMREMLIGSSLMTLRLFLVNNGIKNEMKDHSNV